MLPDPDETALVLEQRQRAEAAASTAASAVANLQTAQMCERGEGGTTCASSFKF